MTSADSNRSPWPSGGTALLLTAFLSAATVPALLSWSSNDQGRVLRGRAEELTKLLRAGVEGRRESLPSLPGSERAPVALTGAPVGDGTRFKSELVFSSAQVELFRQKSAREGEFERALKPPEALTATATRDGIGLGWTTPTSLAPLRASIANQPLLRLGFRVYRWREGEEPQLLSTFDDQRTEYQDRDLPVRRTRFFYCVVTVLEGTIGELPTLIESKRSAVITAETEETFTLTLMDGSEERVHFAVSAWIDGIERGAEVEVGLGESVRAEVPREVAGQVVPFTIDTGLALRSLRFETGSATSTVERPEFQPDGRRKLDPTSGLPTFRKETLTTPTRTLEALLADESGVTRSIKSQPK